jgi:CHAT domain-containing protein
VADPEFGEAAPGGSSAQRRLGLQVGAPQAAGAASIDLSQVVFKPLRGTEDEARALGSLLPGATVLTRERATESAVKQADGPRLLHIATHGFFLDDRVVAAGNVQSINPLLRSGLGLAGVNQRKSGNDDGILTALEAASLNLQGTKLVVLSACDTGVGEVRAGDGVYGLRRALVLAGSETQVMSLWPVSDTATRDLMIEYYKRLQRGEGRGEALRRVQLMMLRRGAVGETGAARLLKQKGEDGQPAPKPASARARKDFRHPYYWASFIPSGEWGNLDGKR